MNARSNHPTPANQNRATEEAATVFLALLTENGCAPTYAPKHGSGDAGANPWADDNPLAEAYGRGWHWAHNAMLEGRNAYQSGVTRSPYAGPWGEIYDVAKEAMARKLGVAEAA